MIQPIVKDTEVLQRPSAAVAPNEDVTNEVIDLLDTAKSYGTYCAGIAAVQIGIHKCIIAIRKDEENFLVMINPRITWRSTQTATNEEGCLSLEGTRTVTRPINIEVMYQPRPGAKYKKLRVGGFTARCIQHEIDHTKGVLV